MTLTRLALTLARSDCGSDKSDGEPVSFGYACDGGEAFLRGDQACWQGMDVDPLDEFKQLLSKNVGN